QPSLRDLPSSGIGAGVETPGNSSPPLWDNHFDLRAGMCVLGMMVSLWLGRTVPAFAQEAPLPEHQVKAAFIINFPKYVDWPAEAFADPNSPIVIVILGEAKVTEEIQKIITGRTVNGREIVLKRLGSGEEPGVCH